MPDPNRLVDQCVRKGLTYLAESLQYYWPNWVSEYPHENNIALHLARSFAEKGFQVWAEIPLTKYKGEKGEHLDFLAYNYSEEITVVLEFKGSVETPQGNINDLKRLIDIHNGEDRFYSKGSYGGWPADAYNPSAKSTGRKIYGVATFHHAMEFTKWWLKPEHYDYMPFDEKDKKAKNRAPKDYKPIGRAINVATYRDVVLLEDFFRYNCPPDSKYRFRYAAYALFDESSINKLENVLNVLVGMEK